ncbi:type II secretion system F family protein [Paenibacillus filicis]|uniref:Type II secretion system F family protein n=1 Tax=Paenibacillus gyeongsangnamensis TaxID=3388067 RepID=A0ABT4QGE4_9BACL|nr:type II secretion system F family protein [Paenibacillus filicis]MCZ8515872.1 type II secretion system F family protein [Paenibacillus filicis]
MWLLFLLEMSAFGAVWFLSYPRYASWIRSHPGGENPVWREAGAPGLWLIDRCKAADRFPEAVGKVHHVMIGLYGAKTAAFYTRTFLAGSVLASYGLILFVTLIACLSEGTLELIGYGALLALLVPFAGYKHFSDRLKLKKRRMLLELPELLNELMLLVNAGETVQQALIRIVEVRERAPGPLLVELSGAVKALRMNVSFTKALEDFSKRCALQEVSLFTTALMLNYKRGGEELVLSLRELSVMLWDKRKALARTLGEEASSKLVFPMVLIFFVVMVIVAAPALMMMS